LVAFLTLLNAEEKTFIVEGKFDKEALLELGVRESSIVVLHQSNTSLELFAERWGGKNVVILTDLDREGKKIYVTLKDALIRHGAKIDRYYREWIQEYTTVKQIEDLATFLTKEKMRLKIDTI